MRHGGGHLLVHRHLFLDGALHANQADAELVFEQFANGAHAAVSQVVDVVHGADVLAQLQQVTDGRDEVAGIERARLQRRFQAQLDIELQPPDLAEIVFPGIEKHPVEERRGGFERRRIAGTQLAIDLDQRLARGTNGVLIERARDHHAGLVAVREENIHAGDARFGQSRPDFGGQRAVGFEQHFAGLAIDQVGDRVGALEIGQGYVHLGHLGFHQFLVERFGDAPVRGDEHVIALRALDLVRNLAVDQAFGKVPVEIAIAQRDAFRLIERAQNFFIRLHAQRAEENGAEELALAVDAHVENVLGVVLELDPGAAIGNDLAQEVAAAVGRLVEHAGRAVQLADDDALGPIDDERAVIGHQRNVAEKDLLLLDVADILRARVGILVVDGQADGDLERRGVGHAALLAFVHVVLELHAHRIAALIAERGRVLIERAALGADHVPGLIGIGDDRSAALAASCPQVMQALEVAALAFPIPDRVIHEVELRQPAEILDGKHGAEHRLQAGVFPLRWKQIHLQEALIGHALHFNQVRNLDGALDLGEVQTLPLANCMISILHSVTS